MNKYYLFVFTVIQVIYALAGNAAKFSHDDLKVSNEDLKPVDLTKSPTGDRVDTASVHPEWRSENSQYDESAEKDANESLLGFDDLDDSAVSRDAYSQDGLDEILGRNGVKDNKKDHLLTRLSRTKSEEREFTIENDKSDSNIDLNSEFKLPRRRNLDASDEQKQRDDNDNNNYNLDGSGLSEINMNANDEQKSHYDNDRYLDYNRELNHFESKNMDSIITTPRTESRGSDYVNPPTFLSNTFPVYRSHFGNFAPFAYPLRIPITLTYPTTRFVPVLNNPYNLGTTTTGPTSYQDYSNNYPYLGFKEFGFHTLNSRRTLFK